MLGIAGSDGFENFILFASENSDVDGGRVTGSSVLDFSSAFVFFSFFETFSSGDGTLKRDHVTMDLLDYFFF